ncbi:MAG TPA: hypothetical protein VEU96_16630 [Bryobacteraceae bacterium]|nr:hypothetical protein [Bryobacteraceae bacterium]
MTQSPLLEIGLAEFVHKLISETLESVTSAQAAQERSIAELAVAAALPLSIFAAQIQEADVDGLLQRLFGNPPAGGSLLAVGARYWPAAAGNPENPPIKDVLGLELGTGDYDTRAPDVHTLTVSGVAKIRSAAKLVAARLEQTSIQAVIGRGPQRLQVSGGKINVKASFAIQELTAPAPPAAPAPSVTIPPAPAPQPPPLAPPLVWPPVNPAARPNALAASTAALRVVVRPVDERNPATTSLTANIFGEITLELKAV